MPPTKSTPKPSEALFADSEQSDKPQTGSGDPVNLKAIRQEAYDIYALAVPIYIELIKHEVSKAGLGNHEALASHAFRYARAAIAERDRPFKPVVTVVAQGVRSTAPVEQPAPKVAPLPPNPLAPELPPGMSSATPDELRELMTK